MLPAVCAVSAITNYTVMFGTLQTVNRKCYIACRIAQFWWPWVTFKIIYLLRAFSYVYSCAAVGKTSTDIVRCVVPMR